jgi:hypothetical protein
VRAQTHACNAQQRHDGELSGTLHVRAAQVLRRTIAKGYSFALTLAIRRLGSVTKAA